MQGNTKSPVTGQAGKPRHEARRGREAKRSRFPDGEGIQIPLACLIRGLAINEIAEMKKCGCRRRNSLRYQGHHYRDGLYFLTVCTSGRARLFGRVKDGDMHLNGAGHMVQEVWHQIPHHYPWIANDAFVVMPDHIHGIVDICREKHALLSDEEERRRSLGRMVARFKMLTTRRYVDAVKAGIWPPFDRRMWQRNFYDRIIRDETALHRIRKYIANNPANWPDTTP
jgi:putative transposase